MHHGWQRYGVKMEKVYFTAHKKTMEITHLAIMLVQSQPGVFIPSSTNILTPTRTQSRSQLDYFYLTSAAGYDG